MNHGDFVSGSIKLHFGHKIANQEQSSPAGPGEVFGIGRVIFERLRDVKDALPPYITFDDIRLVVASLRAEKRLGEKTA